MGVQEFKEYNTLRPGIKSPAAVTAILGENKKPMDYAG